tara:strand:- start:394 stop:558 length:165 start_codon:yes stop_codon:yes gene_type:complete
VSSTHLFLLGETETGQVLGLVPGTDPEIVSRSVLETVPRIGPEIGNRSVQVRPY